MTKFSRITGKLFGGSASASGSNPEIAQFGSGLAGTYVGTTDINTIQQLPAWQNGFVGCVTPSEQFPPLPEMTGFGKVLSYIQCYLLQQGVPEWDSNTTYYSGSWCSYNGNLYVSLQDENLNKPVTNPTYWEKFTGGTFARNYGEIVISSLPQTDSTLHLADGSLLSYSDYPSFIDYLASIYTGDTGVFISEADWQASFSNYGECGKYVYNSSTRQVRLPLYASSLKFSSDLSNLGIVTPAGLPPHVHTATTASSGSHTHTESSAGSHTHTINNAGTHKHGMNLSGSHTHTESTTGSHTHTTVFSGEHAHTRGTQNITGTMPNMFYDRLARYTGALYKADSYTTFIGAGVGSSGYNYRTYITGLNAADGWTGESSYNGNHGHEIETAGNHYHTIYSNGSHDHTIIDNGQHTHTESSAGSHTHTINNAGSHTHDITINSGGAIGSSATLKPQSITQLIYIVVAK